MMKRSQALHRTYERLVGLHKDGSLMDSKIQRIIVRPDWNVLIAENGLCGMVINFYGKYSADVSKQPQFEDLNNIVGSTLGDVSERLIDSNDVNMRSIGVCSMAALSNPFLSKEGISGRGMGIADDIIPMIKKTDKVTIVGYGFLVDAMIGRCREVHVTEMRPQHYVQTAIIDDGLRYVPKDILYHPHTENEEVISSSDVVLITASTLVNGTFDTLLGYCENARMKGIYGPSGSIVPDELFSMGMDFSRAYEIVDPGAFEKDAIHSRALESSIKKNQSYQWIIRK